MFRPPLGGAQTRRLGFGEEIVQYSNVDEKWSLKVSRMILDRPARLLPADDKKSGEPALLEEASHQLLIQNVNTEILRKNVVNVGLLDVGLLISRFTQSGSFWLRQQAFIQANSRVYYVFDFMTPSRRTATDKPEEEDPAERMGIEIFRAMLDTVALLDQREIIEDNDRRLFRTRSFQVGLDDTIRKAAIPDQYFRVLREGKDVGWIYIAEELGEFQGHSGVFVAGLTLGRPDDKSAVSISSEAFCSLDFKQAYESWLAITESVRDGRRGRLVEIGESAKRTRNILDKKAAPDKRDPRQPAIKSIDLYKLSVTQSDPTGSRKSIERDLPSYYLPQAVGSMVPRLLPRKEPREYLFAVWVGGEREVMYRYLDVEAEHDVLFNGQNIRAVTIKDRIGLEGDPAYHYFSPEGKYLGSTSAATGVVIVAADLQAITKIWPDAKPVRPRLLDSK